jgi:hypothetical protein
MKPEQTATNMDRAELERVLTSERALYQRRQQLRAPRKETEQ